MALISGEQGNGNLKNLYFEPVKYVKSLHSTMAIFQSNVFKISRAMYSLCSVLCPAHTYLCTELFFLWQDILSSPLFSKGTLLKDKEDLQTPDQRNVPWLSLVSPVGSCNRKIWNLPQIQQIFCQIQILLLHIQLAWPLKVSCIGSVRKDMQS